MRSAPRADMGGLVLVTGEAGIGKTRLLSELDRIAVAAGARLVRGTCWERGRGAGVLAVVPGAARLRARGRAGPDPVPALRRGGHGAARGRRRAAAGGRPYHTGSVLHCLPVGMAEQPSAGPGALMRPDTVRRDAAEAGYAQVRILPIEDDFFRFYRLDA
jgi:hypothetical protein